MSVFIVCVGLLLQSIIILGKQSLEEFREDVLKAHTEYRANHGTPSLLMNEGLNHVSQTWAEHLASIGRFKNSKDARRGRVGESLSRIIDMSSTGQDVVDELYNSRDTFTYGYYAQVIWKGTKYLGVGRATASDGSDFTVFNYYPVGNVRGQEEENILPLLNP